MKDVFWGRLDYLIFDISFTFIFVMHKIMLVVVYILLSIILVTSEIALIIYGTVSAKIAPRLKCYKNASRLNCYNFPTDNAIDFLYSTLHHHFNMKG